MLGVKTKRDRQFELLDSRLIDIQGRLAKIRTSQTEQAKLDKDRFDALINALGPIANLGFIKDELETIHRLVSDLTNPPSQPEPFTPFRVEPDSGFIETGDIQSMQITDSQQFKITFPAPKDKKGFPAKVQDGSVAITVGNDTATVEPNPDDPSNPFSALVKGNRPGADDGSEATAVSISADADLGEGVKTISKAVELMVTSGEATGFGEPTVGDAEEQG